MDTSPEYVQMCRQAKEIQEQWKREAGDWIVTPEGIRVLSSKVIQIKGEDEVDILKYAIPKRMTLTSPILDSDPISALEQTIDYIDLVMYPAEYCHWLPRQDQLQAMVFEKTALSLACRFKDFIVRPMFDELMPNRKEQMAFMMKASMEQLYLCFVMHTLYKLRGDGTGWVAE